MPITFPSDTKIKWDGEGTRQYQTGVSHGALYVWHDASGEGSSAVAAGYGKAIPWSGLTAVNQNPSGAEATALYADNIKYLNLISAENFAATIEAYDYPDEFEECDGSKSLITGVLAGQQTRKKFCFAYVTNVGSDTDAEESLKLHIIYGCTAACSARNYQTVNESPEAITFSWEVSTTPVAVTGAQPTAHLEIDAKAIGQTKFNALCYTLFGTGTTEGTILMPDSVVSTIQSAT